LSTATRSARTRERLSRLARGRVRSLPRANQEDGRALARGEHETLSKEDFVKAVRDGRLDKGMMSFASSKVVMDNIDNLYALSEEGRSNGDITRAKVEELKP
jgi:hypothetical protein